ncbi:ROK family protein [Gryllotalpicola ginsengisoli]|uniref:ROK family protein n=1 Tax=Gryllotalpicola ginsengisoli TaxID=444608 RepID=UPI0003B402F7|nr:ROK family protein [Gryllotalpicola ginsengisoli]
MRLGLDIGGTKIDAVALSDDGDVAGLVRVPTGHGPDAVVAAAVAAARQAAELAGGVPTSLGAGIPGVVDPATGRVRHAVNLGVVDLGLGALLAERLGVPVRVENDVNAASLGAYHLLGLDGPMAFLNLGTGVAAGFVSGGRLWRGARGTAGEIGHIPIDPDGARCNCGQRGCVETVASGGGVARQWATDAPFPVLDVFDRADAGDPAALAVRDRLAAGAAAAVRILVLTADVETVVIGGGVSSLGDRLLRLVAAALAEQAAVSGFLASLELPARVRLAPQERPVAAIGAALAEPA